MIAHSVAEQLRLIDRGVTALSRSTEALLRATEESALLEEICHVAVDVAGYRLAWIGYARDDDSHSVVPVAQAGLAHSYVREIRVDWSNGPFGQGPTGTAIRTGQSQVVRDTENDLRFAPWRDAARRYGFRSVAALVLGYGDTRLGALNIYASEADAFDADVIHLLEDMARNLSYGIRSLRMKAEHDQAVRDLAESEERYRSLIEMTPDAIVVHSQGGIVFANAASARVFGSGPAGSLVGCPLLDLIHPDHRPAAAARLADPHAARQVAEWPMLRLDGSSFDAEISAATISFHGLPARLLVIRDISERKQVQEQLFQTAKLATLGEMAAGLVHELSQPLNIIRLTAEGALMFIERGKAPQDWQTQQFHLVADQAQRTAEIIDSIRIFSRRDSGPVQVFDAAAALRAAISVLEGQLRPDGITLQTDLPATPVPVRGRRVQLEQVILNLISNAHQALRGIAPQKPPGWRPQIRVTADMVLGKLMVTVADNGPGIPASARPRIFEPFFTTKEAGRGTGLGLSVSFGIIDAMGGQLGLENPADGAAFCFTLPVDTQAPDIVLEPPSPPDAPDNAHIMVVDDEQAAAQSLGQFLTGMGFRVTVAANGQQAYECFMADPADVVISDLRMPAGDGEQLAEKLRDYDPLLPIVIVTGHLGATERLSESMQDDRCAILKKPVALGRLGEVISSFLKPPSE